MRYVTTKIPGLALASAVCCIMASTAALGFPEGSEPKLTGGQGFDDCSSCHFAGPAMMETSGIQLHGLAEKMVPGEVYQLTLEVSDPQQRLGGFQLTFRDLASGASVGQLEQGEGQHILKHENVEFLAHSEPQHAQQVGDEQLTRWQFGWRAGAAETLEISVAAVAGDGDDSSLGDNVYTFSRILPTNERP